MKFLTPHIFPTSNLGLSFLLFSCKNWLFGLAACLMLLGMGCERGPQYDYRPEADKNFTPESIAHFLNPDSLMASWSEMGDRMKYDSLMVLTVLLQDYREEVALQYAEEARSLATQKDWRYARAVSSYYVAMLKGRKEYYGEGIADALVDAELSRMLIRENETYWWASIHHIIGNFYTSQGRIDSAQKYLDMALTAVEKGAIATEDSLELRGAITHELLRIAEFTQPEAVDSLFEESLLLFRLAQDEPAIARLRLLLAMIKGFQEELDQALGLIDMVLEYAIEEQDIILQAEALQRKGWVEMQCYFNNKQESYFEDVRASLQQALNLQTNNKYYTYDLLGNLYQRKFILTGEPDFVKIAITYFKWAIINAREEGQLELVKNMGYNILSICSVLSNKQTDVDCEKILGESTAEFLNTNYTGIVDSITLELTGANVQTQRYQRMELESASSRKRKNQLFVFLGILVTAGLIFLLLLQQQQKRRLKARMEALRAQINPHFISNSLNAIESLVNLDQKEAASKYLVHFSRLSRRILNSSREANTSLAGELETLKHFLALEQLRFRDKLSYKIEVEDGINPLLFEVPSMIMQPYVENAIWHGLKPKSSPGMLSIYVQKQGKSLLCSIEDDGIGREKSRELKEKSVLKRKSLGMQITEERLQENKKAKAGTVEIIDLKDEEGNALGTRVMLYLPIKKRKKITDSTPLR